MLYRTGRNADSIQWTEFSSVEHVARTRYEEPCFSSLVVQRVALVVGSPRPEGFKLLWCKETTANSFGREAMDTHTM